LKKRRRGKNYIFKTNIAICKVLRFT